MRIMFFNMTCGHYHPEIMQYIKRKSASIDIFCLSEVHRLVRRTLYTPERVFPNYGKRQHTELDLFGKLVTELQATHIGKHAPNVRRLHDLEPMSEHFDCDYGLATFFRFAWRPETYRVGSLHRPFGQENDGLPASRSLVSMTVNVGGKRLLVAHMHGLWDSRGKIDTKERDTQTERVLLHLRQHHEAESWDKSLPIIFGGDLNLTSRCRALSKLVESSVFGPGGGVNLNERFSITNTRTSHYEKDEREADFVITSGDIDARLEVDYDAPSDHAALILTV